MPHCAVQRELSDRQAAIQAAGRQLVGGEQHAERDWQVVGWAFLAHGGGGQVDDHAPARERLPGVNVCGVRKKVR